MMLVSLMGLKYIFSMKGRERGLVAMETNIKDYVLCGLILTAITCVGILATFLVTSAVSWLLPLGEYQVVLGTLLFLLFYGFISGLAIRFFVKFRPLKEGYFTMNSTTFMDWKLLIMMSNFGQRALAPFNFFFLGSVFAALYGAKIGKNSAVSVPLVDAFMVEIGDNSIVGAGTLICGNYLEKDKIFISPIKIGHNVTIGMNCVVLPNTVIGDGATLSIGSVVMPGTVIPAGETWKGNPARKWQ